ncbi:GFA family protein [Aestuariivirga sp.]|uniref:GFA family protein n=1 Tax=Aestuariivirga sp. TaxID=2650926 RepID=UPI0039190A1E
MIPALPITGGCLCGAIRYQAAEPPSGGYFCHCTMCQKSYGGLFMTSLKFASTAFATVRGDVTYYRSSRIAERGFCINCGSPLVFRYDNVENVWVSLGSLDRPFDWPLTAEAAWGEVKHVCIESKVPWYSIADGLDQRPLEQMVSRNAALGVCGRSAISSSPEDARSTAAPFGARHPERTSR